MKSTDLILQAVLFSLLLSFGIANHQWKHRGGKRVATGVLKNYIAFHEAKKTRLSQVHFQVHYLKT
jgi:hypothetical protein